MSCEKYAPLLSAKVDGELPDDRAAELRDHLASCAACTAELAAVRGQHTDLRQAFAQRVAAVAAAPSLDVTLESGGQSADHAAGAGVSAVSTMPSAAVTAKSVDFQARLRPARSSVVAWICAAAAALLILAFGWSRPAEEWGPGSSTLMAGDVRPAARVLVTTGDVQMATMDNLQLRSCVAQTELPSGWKLVTGENARCELVAPASGSVRLDENTEVAQVDDNTLRLTNGKLWTTATDDVCKIQAPTTEVTAQNATFELSCSPGSNQTELSVFDGTVSFMCPDGSVRNVAKGESLKLDNGALQFVPLDDPVMKTRWLNDILLAKGNNDAELVDRVEQLWNQIAENNSPKSSEYESELRVLGACSVGPLCDWVQSTESQKLPTKRAQAAKLLSDLAGSDSIPRLIELLSDTDGEVRYFAALALHRLTGESYGQSPDEWRKGLTKESHDKTGGEYQNWWRDKKIGKFPQGN